MEEFLEECRLVALLTGFGFSFALIYHFIKISTCRICEILKWVRDIIIGAVGGLIWFLLLLDMNNGQLKFVYFVATFLGSCLYARLLGRSVVRCFDEDNSDLSEVTKK